jgi:hypothetical protein
MNNQSSIKNKVLWIKWILWMALSNVFFFPALHAKSEYVLPNSSFHFSSKILRHLYQDLKKDFFCTTLLPRCIRFQSIIQLRHSTWLHFKKSHHLFKFPFVINSQKVADIAQRLHFSKIKQRQFVQSASLSLNQKSYQWLNDHTSFFIERSNAIFLLAINNAILTIDDSTSSFTLKKHHLKKKHIERTNIESKRSPLHSNKIKTLLKKNSIIIGLLDSGVSLYHQQMQAIKVKQYNPIDDSYQLKDTAFGHATGILSLLAVKANKTISAGYIHNGTYLSCNGLNQGKYNAITILQCMNWFFLQPRVDVIINAWLASKKGCSNEWRIPLIALLSANTIPIFSAGNYALSHQSHPNRMNYAPANTVFEDKIPLITVGALSKNNQRLSMSSYGVSHCHTNLKKNTPLSWKHYQANFFSLGEALKAAVPWKKDTYQILKGSSFSVVKVAAILAQLIQKHPHNSHSQIIHSLYVTADSLGKSKIYGYGKINPKKASLWLKKTIRKKR